MRTKIIALLFVVTAGCLSLTAQNRGGGDVDIDLLRKLQYAQLAITNLYVDSVDQN